MAVYIYFSIHHLTYSSVRISCEKKIRPPTLRPRKSKLLGFTMVKIFKQRSDVTGHLASEGYTSPLVSGGGTMAGSAGEDSGNLFLMFGGPACTGQMPLIC